MLRVLLVDDEPFILRGMKELIDWKNEGFEIVGSAADGEEALLFLQNHDADLILSDIKMPIMDGHRLTKLVKDDDETKDIPVVIFSSLVNDEMRRKGASLGANAQLSKPEIGNLVRVIDSLLA